MKINLSKKSFTLVELIISSVLVIVVLLGMFSINMVLSNNSQDYGQRYLLKSETQTTLDHILNNASLAVGSANCNDEAILPSRNPCSSGPNLVDPDTFCIHQAGGNNIIGSAADIWLCYSLIPANFDIEWCAEIYPGAVNDPRGASSCPAAVAAGTVIPDPATGNSTTFLGTANTSGLGGLSATFLSNVFSITLYNCLNNAALSCNGSDQGVSSDPVNNPEIQISGSVSPLQANNG